MFLSDTCEKNIYIQGVQEKSTRQIFKIRIKNDFQSLKLTLNHMQKKILGKVSVLKIGMPLEGLEQWLSQISKYMLFKGL